MQNKEKEADLNAVLEQQKVTHDLCTEVHTAGQTLRGKLDIQQTMSGIANAYVARAMDGENGLTYADAAGDLIPVLREKFSGLSKEELTSLVMYHEVGVFINGVDSTLDGLREVAGMIKEL